MLSPSHSTSRTSDTTSTALIVPNASDDHQRAGGPGARATGRAIADGHDQRGAAPHQVVADEGLDRRRHDQRPRRAPSRAVPARAGRPPAVPPRRDGSCRTPRGKRTRPERRADRPKGRSASRPISRCGSGRTPDVRADRQIPRMGAMPSRRRPDRPPVTPPPVADRRRWPRLRRATRCSAVSAAGASTTGERPSGSGLRSSSVVLAAAGAVGPAFGSGSAVPGSDSDAGFAVLEEHFPELGTGGQSGTIVFRAEQGVDDPEVVAAMEELFATVDAGFPDETACRERRARPSSRPTRTEGGGPDRLDRPAGRPAGVRPGEPVGRRRRHRVGPDRRR